MHDIKGVQEPSKGKESDSSKIACGFSEGSFATGAAKTHSALVAVQGFIQEKFSIVVYPGKRRFFDSNI